MHLIIGKEREEVRRELCTLLKEGADPITHFYPATFTSDLFLQEVETPPFLSSKKRVILYEIDQLDEVGKETLLHYVEKPTSWVNLYLTASELTSHTKLARAIEKKGKIIRFKEEKPWEKEKRLAEWVIAEAKQAGCRFSREGALALVKEVDHQMLQPELDKLICYAGSRGEINLEDIKALSTPTPHETLWQLGDALFGGDTPHALKIGRALLEEGTSIHPLLAHVRSQFSTGIDILQAAEEGVVTAHFPYLKGKLLDKKLQLLRKQGKERIKQGILLIFETEVKAKNSSTDPLLLLELLIVKLGYDAVSAA
jgi:DNA polymerase-3 subunit delta